jgi:DNA adenine methylase
VTAAAGPRRPVLRYHGGKWRLAPWVMGFFPSHRVYTESFGGGGSVLMRKSRAYAEVYNDLTADVVNVFRVLRDPATAEVLRRQLELTPFARAEFEAAYEFSADNVERARRTIARAFMGFGSASAVDVQQSGMRTAASTHRPPTGYRSNSNRSGTTPAHDWANYPSQIPAFVDRLRGVVIEERPAIGVIEQHDRAEALHYIDPPYPHSTRSSWKRGHGRHAYEHEMTDDDHRRLSETLRAVAGMVVLSGYPCDLYDLELYPDWERHERKHLADGARRRVEVIWLNPACARALREEHHQHPLFG